MSAVGSVRHDVSQLLAALSPARRRELIGLTGLVLLGGLAEVTSIGSLVPLLAMLAHSDAGRGDPSILGLTPTSATVLFGLAVIFAGLIRLQLQRATMRTVLGAGHELTVEIQRRTLLQGYAYHIEQHSSALIASLEKVQTVVSGVLLPLVQGTGALLMALCIVAALLRVDARSAIVAGSIIAAAYLLTARLMRKPLATASHEVASAYDQRVRLVQDSVGAIRDIVIDSTHENYLAAFSRVDARFVAARARIASVAAAPRFLIEAAGMVVIAAAALLMASRSGGLATALPVLGALALGAQRLLPLLQQLHQGWVNVVGNRAMLSDVVGLLHLAVPADQLGPVEPLPFRKDVVLRGMAFSYPGSTAPALANVNLVIPRGSSIALAGRSGGGKTTLADIVMGLLTPDAGVIAIDGVPLTRANARAWQRNIAHVPQALFLTDATLAQNIALTFPGEPIDQARLNKAVSGAQLTEFVSTLPAGLEARVGERGVRLSGGQAQRLGLARALYKGATFLVLDEATSALDPHTEAGVLATLRDLQRQGRTILIITHRASVASACDQVVRLDQGQVVARSPEHSRLTPNA